jgi:hypothetical protein
MAARKLAAMAVRVRPKREIIREPGEHKIPGGSTVFQRVLEGFFWGGKNGMEWDS